MIMTRRLSRLMFTSHITFSLGWLGAVAVFLALAIVGLTSRDLQLARAAYLSMELSGWFVIVPFCLASLSTGIVQALGTKWGLFKHYWIVVKLFLTVVSTILLLLHMQPISHMAGVAADASFSDAQEPRLRIQLIADAGAAILVLLATTTISVYKPWDTFKSREKHKKTDSTAPERSWRLYILIGLGAAVLLFLIMHLAGGMHKH